MHSARSALLLAAVLVGLLCVALASAQKPTQSPKNPPSPSPDPNADPNPGALLNSDGDCSVYANDVPSFCPLSQLTCSFNHYRCWRVAFQLTQKIADHNCVRFPAWKANCEYSRSHGIPLTGASDWNPNNALNGQDNLDITICGTNIVTPGLKRSKVGGLFDADAYFGPQQEKRDFGSVNRDWRSTGAVTAVTYQGSSSSCWAHATVAALEFAWAKTFQFQRSAVPLSTQQLIDCTYPYGNGYGAQGLGAPNNVFEYLIHGSVFWGQSVAIRIGDPSITNSYSMSSPGYGCRHDTLGHFDGSVTTGYPMAVRGYVSAWMNGNETTLQTIANNQVAAVGYYASTSFKSFAGPGIYSNGEWTSINATTLTVPRLNHAVALVGVYSQGSFSYFIIKNSYGTSWGDAGYAKMSHDGTNNGGIATWAFWPTNCEASTNY